MRMQAARAKNSPERLIGGRKLAAELQHRVAIVLADEEGRDRQATRSGRSARP